jgi:cbb3-type cytochrome oxidase maturation protein
MSVIILLLLVSIFIAGGFLVAFMWSVRDGQFDDDYSPARRILFDDNKEKVGAKRRSRPVGVAGEQGARSKE